jgi:hypothetical protein
MGRVNLSTVAIPVAVPASYEFLNLAVTELMLFVFLVQHWTMKTEEAVAV